MITHLARLNGIGRCEPAAIEKSDGGLGAETTHAAAACVTERAERLPIEEISRPPGQPLLDGGGGLRRHHVQQLQIRPGRFESRRLAWAEQHTGACFGCVRLAVEADDAFFRRLYDVDEVVVIGCLDLELATL